jgi:Domain of unknown function (DUF1330)
MMPTWLETGFDDISGVYPHDDDRPSRDGRLCEQCRPHVPGPRRDPACGYVPHEILEGPAHEGMVILAFPDKASALGWYNSPAYREVREHCFNGAVYQVTLVEGL